MAITMSGVIHGRRIDLDGEARLPDGSPVVIRIEPQELTLVERQELVRATAGAWADDPSTDAIFAALLRERCADVGRDVRFDDPA